MATYTSVTKFDSDGDGILDTSAQGTLTREFDGQGNLFHELSTIPDFEDESRFTYDANNQVATEVTERHGTATSGLAKLLVLAADRGTDGVIDHRTISEQFTYDDQGRQITHTVDTDAGADGSINERSVYTTVYTNADNGQSTLTVDTGWMGPWISASPLRIRTTRTTTCLPVTSWPITTPTARSITARS